MQKEFQIFEEHLAEKGLKHSDKRDVILKTFLDSDRHMSAEDLTELVKRRDPAIGYTTVYRTLKLIEESGLAEQVDFNDGVKRFEKKLGKAYHAHFICTQCGKSLEAFDNHIADLTSRLAETQGFVAQKQRFEIFGVCQECR